MAKKIEEPKEGPIPKGFIPVAKTYMIGSMTSEGAKLMKIGGKVMMEFVVEEQMQIEHIVSFHGVGEIKCIILVDYTDEEIMHFMRNARIKIGKLAN